MGLLMKMVFYPTLLYNVIRNRISSSDWPWYCRIDETVVLGAVPFKSMVDKLIKEENIGAVVSVNEPHEICNRWVAGKEDWNARGVEHFWLCVPDFFGSPPVDDLHSAVKFMNHAQKSGKSVYVHCKAGRTRSVTLAMCYLMQKHQWYSPAAYTAVKAKRPRIILYHQQWRTIEEYGKQYVWGADRTSCT
ncbi:unnamed protein product [Soboliphyme baturini]|uniref:Phosphatidylglycerophosphatase and protein-tyrosine phosphatase 1 n=1 Tax=Soboliphyme baturini TaxID=241478 RepID=A0A183J5Q9_9BILA|nr:unnamed protein product [Soboliphyme baturini]